MLTAGGFFVGSLTISYGLLDALSTELLDGLMLGLWVLGLLVLGLWVVPLSFTGYPIFGALLTAHKVVLQALGLINTNPKTCSSKLSLPFLIPPCHRIPNQAIFFPGIK